MVNRLFIFALSQGQANHPNHSQITQPNLHGVDMSITGRKENNVHHFELFAEMRKSYTLLEEVNYSNVTCRYKISSITISDLL